MWYHYITNKKGDGITMIEILNERRKYPRFNLRLPVQYRNVKTPTIPFTGALTKNICEGGIRFIGNEFLSLANRLILTVSLPAPSRPIKVITKVAWISKVPMGDQYEIGSQFLTMSEEDKRELKDYLEKAKAASSS